MKNGDKFEKSKVIEIAKMVTTQKLRKLANTIDAIWDAIRTAFDPEKCSEQLRLSSIDGEPQRVRPGTEKCEKKLLLFCF